MRVLDSQRLVITEDESYKLGLACETLPQCEELKPRLLFLVTFADGSLHYVLAEDEAGAIGQAACAPGRGFEEQQAIEAKATAVRLPFRIRGWSYQTF